MLPATNIKEPIGKEPKEVRDQLNTIDKKSTRTKTSPEFFFLKRFYHGSKNLECRVF